MKTSLFASLLLVPTALGCGGLDEAPAAPSPIQAEAVEMEKSAFGGDGDPSASALADGAPGGAAPAATQAKARKMAPRDEAPAEPVAEEQAPAEPDAPMRSWFPETLLFAPAVLTDDDGRARVDVMVPDRLTTWRVLALAHSRTGAQAGDVARFVGTLPTYVDLVSPPFVYAGDRFTLPVQVVNTTAGAVAGRLTLSVDGGAADEGTRAVTAPAGGSRTEALQIVAGKPGRLSVRAHLGAEDAVERTVEVRPKGMPATQQRGGTLASPRQLSLALPDDVEPGSARVRLQVFPGALALLRAELSTAPSRASVDDDAYLLLLSGRAPALARQLGGEVDEEELRRLRLIATQRAFRHARAPAASTAALFAEAALAHPTSPVLSRLGERLAAQVAATQRPDGTFSDGGGWTLPRLLVATATSLRAVRAGGTEGAAHRRATRATLLASKAFERHKERVADAYTAASMVASGAVEGALKEELNDVILKAIVQREDGSRVLPVPEEAQRPDGSRPSETEATAIAALALMEDERAKDVLYDLGASLIASYRAGHGFGDGVTNLNALLAVTQLFKEPLPSTVDVELLLDGEPLAKGSLSGAKLREIVVLSADLEGGGARRFEVKATPPVPGLGFSLEVRYSVPWPAPAEEPGLELLIEREEPLIVGQPAEVALTASAPGGMALRVRHALPAGVQPDVLSLEALVASGELTRFSVGEGAVLLEAPSRAQGQAFHVRYRVVPTLAGSLYAGASSVSPASGSSPGGVYLRPSTWSVRR